MSNREIELQKKRTSKLNFFIGGFILTGFTFVLGLLWVFISPFSMVGFLAYDLLLGNAEIFPFPYALGIYFMIFLYGSLINFVILKRSASKNKVIRTILLLLVFLLIVFYLLALFLGLLGNG